MYLLKIKYYLLILLFLSFFKGINSQNAVLILTSQDSLAFSISINGQPMEDSLQVQHEISFEAFENPIEIEAKFKDGLETKKSFELMTNTISKYDVINTKGMYLFVQTSLSQIPEETEVVQERSALTEQNTDVLDEVMVETDEITEPLAPSIQGCSGVSASYEIEDIIKTLESKQFEFQKIEYLNNALVDECYRVKDLSKIIEKIEYEDQRLDLMKVAYDSTYDLENYPQLVKLLYLKQNVDNFLSFSLKKSRSLEY